MLKMNIFRFLSLVIILLASFMSIGAWATSMDEYKISGHGQGHVKYPTWFLESFLDLQDDLEDARDSGKRGIIVMFSQKNCSHCQAFVETTLSDTKTKQRVKKSYNVIGLDIFSDNELTYINGTTTTVKDFAEAAKARLTPTLLFIGIENKILLKIIGFYPPEKFNHVLDYLEQNHHKNMKLRDYLQKKKQIKNADLQPVKFDLNLFEKTPFSLNKTTVKDNRPLLVVFENPNCNACKRFHNQVLKDKAVRGLMGKFRAVQVDASDSIVKITSPTGKKVTPKDWANQLQINYDIAIIFFDSQGKEVHRIDSEFAKDRMSGSMQYVLEKAYERHAQYLQWRKEQALKR